MSENNTITDNGGDPKYYIITPQIVLALCDNPYQYTLWNVIKNVAGELGECYLATDDLATMAMMSAGKCSESRKALIKKGLLQGEIRKDPGYPQPVWHLIIPNLWQDNIKWREAHQSLKERIELKSLQLASFHKVKPSLGEEGIPLGEEGIPLGETKKNQKEKPKEDSLFSLGKNGSTQPSEQPKKELYNYFLEYTNIPPPQDKKETGFWYSQLAIILNLAQGDARAGKKLIKSAYDKLTADDLTISSPGSLIKTIRFQVSQGKQKIRIT